MICELYQAYITDTIKKNEFGVIVLRNMFIIGKNTDIYAGDGVLSDILAELWSGFCAGLGKINPISASEDCISIGKASFIALDPGDEYTVCIRKDGVGIRGCSRSGLIRGFIMLMMCIEHITRDELGVECRDIHGNFSVANRMVHLCAFPETTFETLQRQVRLCGILQYTHIIIEFWGMLRYDCLKELSWPFAYEKSQIKSLVKEIRGMGMEPVPMFNHLGHASQCRVCNGKHTVLDQNPALGYLFTPDGWAWNIESEDTLQLLRSIRQEQYDLFGDGEYIHLGCDEAYIFSNGYISNSVLRDYLGKITSQAVAEGRKPIVWADMLVCYEEADCVGEDYYCASIKTEEAELIRSALAPEIILADWQYSVTEGQLKTSEVLKRKGYNVVACPWKIDDNIIACVNTAKQQKLFGVMQTAWNTLSDKMQTLIICARECGLPETPWSRFASDRTETATFLRCVSKPGRSYEECGFTPHQVGERNLN